MGSMRCGALSDVPLDSLVECMTACFENYFVPFGGDSGYWGARFESEGVDYSLSLGMFADSGALVGFVVHAIRNDTAYNACTGVLPEYRGQRIVGQLYAYGLPLMRAAGVTVCTLEVIEDNDRAIRAYQKAGFESVGKYQCFKGFIPPSKLQTTVQEGSEVVLSKDNPYHRFYYWGNTDFVLQRSPPGAFMRHEVAESASQQKIGFFVISPMSGHLAQYEICDSKVVEGTGDSTPADIEHDRTHWLLLFDGIAQIHQAISITNVDNRRCVLIEQLLQLGLENFLYQYAMKLQLVK
jgi:ribosomal protein S18 acetylase RimI-like enzyme